MAMSQCERILRHMEDYGEISQLVALREYGIMRLASRISDLRKAGFTIEKNYRTGKNKYGEPTKWAVYNLKEREEQ